MNIIFMGTPHFAVPTLQTLYENGHVVKMVVTQPDKPSGRGKKIKKSEVKVKAEDLGIPVFQPEKIKDEKNIDIIRKCNPDVIIVVAYGQLLSKEILTLPKYGCINVHASLLPKLRGAAPINWSIINGDVKSGVTTMQMDVGLDTGDMLLKSEVIIKENMTAEELHDELMEAGAKLLLETLSKIENNEIVPQRQDNNQSTYAPMLDKTNTVIDWNDRVQNIHNKIRGLSPWPCAYFIMDGKNIKVYKSKYKVEMPLHQPGYVIKCEKDGIYVQAYDGVLIIEEFQMPGKNKMPVEVYLRGNKFPENIQI